MTVDFRALCIELAKLARRDHYRCEDHWYSCPKSPDGCANDLAGDECNCGADSHNDKIDELLSLIALATLPPEPPKNCWLDDEPDLTPSPCVFDDPSEVINNCTYARAIKCKTDCKYYRVVTHPEPVQAPPPAPPTNEEIAAAIQKGADQEFYATVEALTQYCGCGVELTSGDAREVLYELRRPHIALDGWGNEKPYS